MKRTSLLFLILTFVFAGAVSRTLTPEAALTRAIAAPEIRQTYHLRSTFNDDLKIPAVYEYTGVDRTIFVSAVDGTESLLGWTDHRLADTALMPPAMKEWIAMLTKSLPKAANVSSAVASRKAIEPLLTTTWNQTHPYNMYCPIISGNHAPVGCVATAMAMIVHHNRVFDGSGLLTICNNDGTPRNVDLADIDFDFESMPLSSAYTDGWSDVALLSAVCGVASHMKYGASGSGTYLTDATSALIEHIGYDPQTTIYLKRSSYSIDEWNSILYNELSNGRPVMYAGGITGPHCFVCDGYQPGNYFHFNWGWGGMGNGYYSLTSLIPSVSGIGASESNNYTGAQECVLCRVPGAENALLHLKVSGYCGIASSPDHFKVMFNVVGPAGLFVVDAGYIIESQDGMRVREGQLGQIECRSSASTSTGVVVNAAPVAAGLPAGYYMIYPAFKSEADGVITKANEPKGDYALGMEVYDNGTYKLVEIASAPQLIVEDIKLHGNVYKTTMPDVSFRAVNIGRKDAYTSLNIAVIDPATGNVLRSRTVNNVELASGCTAMFRATVPNYKVGEGYLSAGRYTLAVCDASSDSVMAVAIEPLVVLDSQDPSVVSSSANPTITIERVTFEPELFKVPCDWKQDVTMTVDNAQSATLGVAFFVPGTYTPSYKYTIPYQRWEQCRRVPKVMEISGVNPSPGRYEVAYMAGGQEISTRRTVEVPLLAGGLYYLLNDDSMTASLAAASSELNGHVEVPERIEYLDRDYRVVAVEANAFSNCPTIVSVGLPGSVTNIEGDMFAGSEPAAVMFRSVEPPFAIWQSIFAGLQTIPVSYVPAESYDVYRNILHNNELYSIIDTCESAANEIVIDEYSTVPAIRVTVHPECDTYQKSFIAISDQPDVAVAGDIDYSGNEVFCPISAVSEGSCTVVLSHPQPDLSDLTIAVEIDKVATEINEMEATISAAVIKSGDCLKVTSSGEIDSVYIYDLTGSLLDVFESQHVHTLNVDIGHLSQQPVIVVVTIDGHPISFKLSI